MKISTLLSTLGLTSLAMVAQAQMPSDYTALYRFDNDMNDAATTNPANASTIAGSVSYGQDRFGNNNTAIYFDGNSLIGATNSKFLADTAFTVMAWVSPSAFENYGVIAGVRYNNNASPYNSYLLMSASSAGAGQVSTTTTNDASVTGNTNSLPLGVWSHLAVSYSKGAQTFKLYLNGTLISSRAVFGDVVYNSNPYFAMGDVPTVNSNSWNGFLDDIAFYRRALSDDEIQQTVYPDSSNYPTDYIAHYRFNNSLQDASRNQIHATTGFGTISYAADRHGNPNACAYFDGSSVAQASSSLLLVDTAITIAAWVHPTTFQNWSMVASLRYNAQTSPYNSYSLMAGLGSNYSTASQITTDSTTDLLTIDSTANNLPLNTWSHIAMTYSKSMGKVFVYLNGTQVSEQTLHGNIKYTANNPYLTIGNIVGADSHGWTGYLDELVIYQRALSANELATINSTTTAVDELTPLAKIQHAKLYPNPTTAQLMLAHELGIKSYTVMDLMGRVIMQNQVENATQTIINIESLPASAYVIRTTLANGMTDTQQFIKK